MRPSLRLRFVLERAGIDAVPLATGARAVGENVAEMAAAGGAGHLGPDHPVARVDVRVDALEGCWFHETRPAGARVELRLGAKQLLSAARAAVHARGLRIGVRAGECPLGSLLAQYGVLLRGSGGPATARRTAVCFPWS